MSTPPSNEPTKGSHAKRSRIAIRGRIYCLLVAIGTRLADILLKWLRAPTSVRSNFEGITVLNPLAAGHPGFMPDLIEALKIIRREDPRRFRRVQREIKCISNIDGLGAAAFYLRFGRMCGVRYRECLSVNPPRQRHRSIAVAIVHEATHGAICSRGVRQKGSVRQRVERVCEAEENRFIKRLRKQGGATGSGHDT